MTDAPQNQQPTTPEVPGTPEQPAASGPAAGYPPVQPAAPEKKKSSLGLRIGLAAIGLVVAAVVSFGVRFAFEAFSGPSKQQLIEQGVEEARKQFDPPQQIDEVTTITDVKAESGAIHYYYTLTDVDPAAVTADVLEDIVLPGLCSTPETKKVLDADIAMRYSYLVDETGDSYDLEFTKGDC